MKYLLTVLTNGRQTCLERSLTSFMEHLDPHPERAYVFDDGGATGQPFVSDLAETLGLRYTYQSSPEALGQCGAQARCWDAAAESDLDWVFHIEDDSVLLRPLRLVHLREVLEAEPAVPQMALVRCPWGAEIEYGGYIPMFPGLYQRRTTFIPEYPGTDGPLGEYANWIATTRNWAHAPALYRTQLCRDLAFPAQPGCETEIGPLLLARHPNTVFGLWGWGEPMCAHIGVERAPGAHGY